MRNKLYLMAGSPGRQSDRMVAQMREALESSGCASPAVAYIGTASGDQRSFMKWLEQPLLKAGASAVRMAPLLGKKGDQEQAREILTHSDAVFISGGEVEDGMNGLSDAMREFLRRLLEEGRLFIGLSAGAIMMGAAWPHWDDEENHPENAALFDCLGFSKAIFDTHAEGEGWPELKKAVELMPEGFVGFGIPSGEMAVIDENGVLVPNKRLVQVVNQGGAAVIESPV